MKQIEVSDEVYATLQRLTTGFHQSPNDVLATLLGLPAAQTSGLETSDPLLSYLSGHEFRAKFTDAEKYLAILGWVGARFPGEFDEFVLGLSKGRRYLSQSREDIVERCRHNQARQIPATRYWAIMNIDTATKRRFLTRVLEFVGYRPELIEFVCGQIGMRHPSVRRLRYAA